MRVRLREVADAAAVSEATVSRVVNGKPGVRAETRRKVLQVLADYGYEPPGVSTRPGRAGLVGLIVPELVNPVFPAFAQSIETRLAAHGYTTVLCTATDDGLHEEDYMDMLLERRVSGIVVLSGQNSDTLADHGLYEHLVELGVPLVLLNGAVGGLDVATISTDDTYAAEVAVRHLAALGHRRIACLTGPARYVPVQRKLEGYQRAMAKLVGHASDELVVQGVFSVEGGRAAAEELFGRDVTAIVAASDLMALGAIRAVRSCGGDVPSSLSVVGYDDTALMAFTDPPLTTLRQPVMAMSDATARALLDGIHHRAVPRREYLFRPELIVRHSTGAVPSDDSALARLVAQMPHRQANERARRRQLGGRVAAAAAPHR